MHSHTQTHKHASCKRQHIRPLVSVRLLSRTHILLGHVVFVLYVVAGSADDYDIYLYMCVCAWQIALPHTSLCDIYDHIDTHCATVRAQPIKKSFRPGLGFEDGP